MVTEPKAQLRQMAMQQRREAAAILDPQCAGQALLSQAQELLTSLPSPVPIAAYWPIGDEIDPRPLMEWLYARHWLVGLPVIAASKEPLIFRQWHPHLILETGPHRILQPPESAPVIQPLIMLVPLLAFDQVGHRLGYGGGYYDRTIQRARHDVPGFKAWGLAYAAQEVDKIAAEDTDMILDAVITNLSVKFFSQNP